MLACRSVPWLVLGAAVAVSCAQGSNLDGQLSLGGATGVGASTVSAAQSTTTMSTSAPTAAGAGGTNATTATTSATSNGPGTGGSTSETSSAAGPAATSAGGGSATSVSATASATASTSSTGGPASSSSSASSASSTSGAACAHSLCQSGAKLDSSCDPCVADVCAARPNCCANTWGPGCINQVGTVCKSSACGNPKCGHSVCTAGAAMPPGCDPCATAVCRKDAYCCDSLLGAWDTTCVSEVAAYCTTVAC